MIIKIEHENPDEQILCIQSNCITSLPCICKNCTKIISCVDGCDKCIKHGSTATKGWCIKNSEIESFIAKLFKKSTTLNVLQLKNKKHICAVSSNLSAENVYDYHVLYVEALSCFPITFEFMVYGKEEINYSQYQILKKNNYCNL